MDERETLTSNDVGAVKIAVGEPRIVSAAATMSGHGELGSARAKRLEAVYTEAIRAAMEAGVSVYDAEALAAVRARAREAFFALEREREADAERARQDEQARADEAWRAAREIVTRATKEAE